MPDFFNTLATAQWTPDSPGDFNLDDPGVDSHSGMAPDTPTLPVFITVAASNSRKRKLPDDMASPALQAASRDVVPSYPVKKSKENHGEMRAIP